MQSFFVECSDDTKGKKEQLESVSILSQIYCTILNLDIPVLVQLPPVIVTVMRIYANHLYLLENRKQNLEYRTAI